MKKWFMYLLALMIMLPGCACAVDLGSMEPGADGKLHPAYAISEGKLTLSGTAAYPVEILLDHETPVLELTLDQVSIPGADGTALDIQYGGEDGNLVVVLKGENTLTGAMSFSNPVGDAGSPMRICSSEDAALIADGISTEGRLEIAGCSVDVTGKIFAHEIAAADCDVVISAAENGVLGENGKLWVYGGGLLLENTILEVNSDSCVAVEAASVDIRSGSSVTVNLSGDVPMGVLSSGLMTVSESTVSVYADAAYPSGVGTGGAEISGGSTVSVEINGDHGYGFTSSEGVKLSGSRLNVVSRGDSNAGVELLKGNLSVDSGSSLSSVCTGENTTGVRMLDGSLEIGGSAYIMAQGRAVSGRIACGDGMIIQHKNSELDPWETLEEPETDRKMVRSIESVPFTYTISAGEVTVTGYTGAAAEITIPAEIEGYPVRTIGNNAFRNSALTGVTLPEGIRTIGSSAFYGCSALTSIALPQSLTEIGGYAFYKCEKLGRIDLPESLESIGDAAFSVCNSLTAVVIPAGVREIEDKAFSGCDQLTEIAVQESNASFVSVDGVLFDRAMEKLLCYPAAKAGEEYAIPDTVRVIGGGAFDGSAYLTGVSIPYGVAEIGDSAFAVTKIAQLILPDTLTTIGDSAFFGSNLTSVVIPDSVTSIGWQAFRMSDTLESAVLPAGIERIEDHMFAACDSLKEIAIPSGVKYIGQMAFYSTALERVSLPEGVESIGFQAYASCGALEQIVIPRSVTSIHETALKDSENAVAHVYAGSYAHTWCEEKGQAYVLMPTPEEAFVYEIKDGTVKITGFTGTDTYVVIPDEIGGYPVTAIGYEAFLDCAFMTDVHIPQSVTAIEHLAFDGCTGIQALILPDNIPAFSKRPFPHGALLYCRRGSVTAGALERLDRFHLYLDSDPENPLTIVDGVVTDCDPAAVAVVVPEGVTAIGDNAFYLCARLESVTLPEGLLTIGSGAFDCCEALTDVVLPEGVTEIGENAFQCCLTLPAINIPESVVSIGDGAFRDCLALEKAIIPDTVLSLGEGVFYETGVKEVSLPAHLTEIGRQMFMFCEQLKSIEIPPAVTRIGGNAFFGCIALEHVELPDGVTEIEGDAFASCTALVSARIPASVVAFGETIFEDCAESFTAIVDYGSAAHEWCVSMGVRYKLVNTPWAEYGVSREEIIANTGHVPGATYVPGSTGKTVLFIQTALQHLGYYDGALTGSYGQRTEQAVKAFQADNGIAADGACGEKTLGRLIDAFLESCGIAAPDAPDIVLPAGLKVISREAFEGAAFAVVQCPDGLEEIGERAFGDCADLRQIIMPESVTRIADDAFDGCGALRIFGAGGSAAERYAAEHGFAFSLYPISE